MSIDCCTYKCNQGRDCPVRATMHPCQEQSDTPTPTQAVADYDAGEPLSPWEAIFLYGCIGASGLLTIVVAGGVLGFIYQRLVG